MENRCRDRRGSAAGVGTPPDSGHLAASRDDVLVT
jgi:hypothetical protein